MVRRMQRTFRRHLLTLTILLAVAVPSVIAQVLDRPVAVVRLTETVNIGQRELRQQIEQLERQLGQQIDAERRADVLEAQIGDVLLNQAAARSGVRVAQAEIEQAILIQRQSIGQPVTDTQFRQIIEQQTGLSWAGYQQEVRERLTQERYILQRAQSAIEAIGVPTDRQIRQVYEENAAEFTSPAMVRFDHIFWDTRGADAAAVSDARRAADSAVRRIDRGQSTFDSVLRASLDDVTYGGGDFGYLIRGDQQAAATLGREFVDAVFDLDEGTVSRVLESSVGIHIVRVTDRRSPRLLELTDPILPGESLTVRAQIVEYIVALRQQEIFQETLEREMESLMNEADITRFPENLNW